MNTKTLAHRYSRRADLYKAICKPHFEGQTTEQLLVGLMTDPGRLDWASACRRVVVKRLLRSRGIDVYNCAGVRA